MKPGIYYDLPAEEYHAQPGASYSRLKQLARSPAHLKAYMDAPNEITTARTIGTVVHQLVLEPDRPHWWAVKPEGMSFATKEGKAWRAQQQATVFLSEDDWTRCRRMADNILNHPEAAPLLVGQSEVSVFGTCEQFDLPVKCRIDKVEELALLVDIKTYDDAREHAFRQQVMSMKYYLQAAWYLDLWNAFSPDKKTGFVNIVVEDKAPHNVMVWPMAKRAIEKGREEYNRLLPIYAQCLRSGEWPGYDNTLKELDLPAYCYKDEE
jgi:exodeoxyribonuclease VIII